MITEIVDQYNFLDQMFRTPVQHAEIENEFSVISFSVLTKDSLNDRITKEIFSQKLNASNSIECRKLPSRYSPNLYQEFFLK